VYNKYPCVRTFGTHHSPTYSPLTSKKGCDGSFISDLVFRVTEYKNQKFCCFLSRLFLCGFFLAIIDLSPASLATSKYLVLLLLDVLEYSASKIVEPNELFSQTVTGEEQEQALDMIGTCSLCPVVLLLMLLNCLLALM